MRHLDEDFAPAPLPFQLLHHLVKVCHVGAWIYLVFWFIFTVANWPKSGWFGALALVVIFIQAAAIYAVGEVVRLLLSIEHRLRTGTKLP